MKLDGLDFSLSDPYLHFYKHGQYFAKLKNLTLCTVLMLLGGKS